MLHVELTPQHSHKLFEFCPKENGCFLLSNQQYHLLEELINQTAFRTFQGCQSFTIVLLKKLLLDLANMKLSLSLLQQLFELLKQYESQLQHFKLHYFQLQKLLFQQQTILNSKPFIHYSENFNHQDYSISLDPSSQSPEHSAVFQSDQRNSKSLVEDIDCYSDQSKQNFVSSFHDKYSCSEYLTTSEDEKQHTSRSMIIQQLKQQLQNKLKIQPYVSTFSFTLEPKPQPLDLDEELLEWKRTKNSIMQQNSLQKAISPNDHEDRDFIKLMKYQHYRQKIKSTIVKKRLSSKHSPT